MTEAYRLLGFGVLLQAARDFHASDPAVFRTARLLFKPGNSLLEFWCSVGGLDPDRVRHEGRNYVPTSRAVSIQIERDNQQLRTHSGQFGTPTKTQRPGQTLMVL